MSTARAIFNEVAALTVGAAATVVSAKGAFAAVDLLFAAGGVPPGLVTGLAGLAMVGVGAVAGGAIGYRGTMAVANELGEALGGPPAAQGQTTGPIVREVAKAWREAPRMNEPAELEKLPYFRRVAARSYIWPHVKL